MERTMSATETRVGAPSNLGPSLFECVHGTRTIIEQIEASIFAPVPKGDKLAMPRSDDNLVELRELMLDNNRRLNIIVDKLGLIGA